MKQMDDEQSLIDAFNRCYVVQQEYIEQWDKGMMQDNTEIVGRWLKKRLLRKHSEAWAIECERALWVLGNCMGDKDVSQIAEFFGCSETDILDVMTTIAVCQCPD